MPEQEVIKVSISLYPLQVATVQQYANDSGLENFSSALRVIITEWARAKSAEAVRLAKHESTATALAVEP